MLNLTVRNTAKLVRSQVKEANIRLGRFFTKKDTAKLMASLIEIDEKKTTYTILDPGAGTGILSAAAVEELCRRAKECKQIFLTCYENEPMFADMLEDNLERIRKKCRHDFNVKLYYSVLRENYLTESATHYTVTLNGSVQDRYDIVLCNPPTYWVEKNSKEAEAIGGITQPKLPASYLFAEMVINNLEPDGQMVFLFPTTVATASALSGFRRDMASNFAITDMHLFVAPQKNADRAIPLKKNIVLRLIPLNPEEGKPLFPETVRITTSTDDGSPAKTEVLPPMPYDLVVQPKDGSLRLVKSVEEAKIYRYISAFPETVDSLGLRMSTGLVLDARCRRMLLSKEVTGAYPLLRLCALRDGLVQFPADSAQKQYIAPLAASVVQPNHNLILIKRVPAKSDARFLNAAVYISSRLPNYQFISTHNKLNYIDTKSGEEMSARFAFGLFALLNSTIYDRYISIISKSKQINAKELRKLPLPPKNVIENIGNRLIALRQTSVDACNSIVNPTLHIIEKK